MKIEVAVHAGGDRPGMAPQGGLMSMVKRAATVAICATAVVVGSASGAVAGEVKGPPGTVDNTNETGALDHANSICAASGLNDFDSSGGQNASIVQTAADSWKYYGLPKGFVGIACRGGGGGGSH